MCAEYGEVSCQGNAVDNRMRLYQHIVLSGGCTMINGLPARLEKDIRAMYLAKVLQVCLDTPYKCQVASETLNHDR